jgi:hypothetical protein
LQLPGAQVHVREQLPGAQRGPTFGAGFPAFAAEYFLLVAAIADVIPTASIPPTTAAASPARRRKLRRPMPASLVPVLSGC